MEFCLSSCYKQVLTILIILLTNFVFKKSNFLSYINLYHLDNITSTIDFIIPPRYAEASSFQKSGKEHLDSNVDLPSQKMKQKLKNNRPKGSSIMDMDEQLKGDLHKQRPSQISEIHIMEQFNLCESIKNNTMDFSDWELMHCSESCTLWRHLIEGSKKSYEYVAKGKFDDVSVKVYNRTMNDLAFRAKWDQNIAEIKILDSYFIKNQDDNNSHTQDDRSDSSFSRHQNVYKNQAHNIDTSSQETNFHTDGPRFLTSNTTEIKSLSMLLSSSTSSALFLLSQISNSFRPYLSYYKLLTLAKKVPYYFSKIFSYFYSPSEIKSFPASKNEYLSVSNPLHHSSLTYSNSSSPQQFINNLSGTPEQQKEEIIYWRLHLPWPLQARDFVYARRIINLPDQDSVICIQEAITHTACPPKKKYVRIEDYSSTLILYPTNPYKNADLPGMEYILYHYDDSRVPLPDWVTTYLTAQIIPTTMKSLYDATKKFKNQFDSSEATSISHNMLTDSSANNNRTTSSSISPSMSNQPTSSYKKFSKSSHFSISPITSHTPETTFSNQASKINSDNSAKSEYFDPQNLDLISPKHISPFKTCLS